MDKSNAKDSGKQLGKCYNDLLFAYGPPVMSLGAGLFRIRAMIARSSITSFDFGGLKI